MRLIVLKKRERSTRESIYALHSLHRAAARGARTVQLDLRIVVRDCVIEGSALECDI